MFWPPATKALSLISLTRRILTASGSRSADSKSGSAQARRIVSISESRSTDRDWAERSFVKPLENMETNRNTAVCIHNFTSSPPYGNPSYNDKAHNLANLRDTYKPWNQAFSQLHCPNVRLPRCHKIPRNSFCISGRNGTPFNLKVLNQLYYG